jgi:hypothetical protein
VHHEGVRDLAGLGSKGWPEMGGVCRERLDVREAGSGWGKTGDIRRLGDSRPISRLYCALACWRFRLRVNGCWMAVFCSRRGTRKGGKDVGRDRDRDIPFVLLCEIAACTLF